LQLCWQQARIMNSHRILTNINLLSAKSAF
jgi:hypothetical protein